MIEDVLGKLKTTLQTYLPARLDVIDSTRGGGIVLDDIASFHTTEYALDTYLNFPTLFLLGVTTDLKFLLKSSANYRDATHRITGIVIVSDVNDSTIETRLWRYAEAIEQILVTHNTLDDTTDRIVEVNVLRYGIADVKRFTTTNTFIQGIGVVIEVKERYSVV